MKIGILGGTFNPIHLAHLRVAKEVCQKFKLDKIFLIPSAIPPHKISHNVADSKDRLEMIRLAIKPYSNFEVSDLEIQRSGFSYTIDTLAYFNSSAWANDSIFFILGIDAFLEIHTWKSYSKLFDLASMIVLNRPCSEFNLFYSWQNTDALNAFETYIKSKISTRYIFNQNKKFYQHPSKKNIFCCHVRPLDISSTDIRKRIRFGKSLDSFLPDLIYKYIKSKGLYL